MACLIRHTFLVIWRRKPPYLSKRLYAAGTVTNRWVKLIQFHMKKCLDEFFVPIRINDESCVKAQPYPFAELCTRQCYLMPDVYLLSRAESMAQLYGMSNAKEFLDGLQQAFGRPASPLNELRKRFDDETLMMSIKRRNIQTPAELQDWLAYLDKQAELADFSIPTQSEDIEDSQSAIPSASSGAEGSKITQG